MHAGSVGRGGGGYIPEDARSHLSAMSSAVRGGGGSKSKSIGDLTGRSSGLLGLSRQGTEGQPSELVFKRNRLNSVSADNDIGLSRQNVPKD